MSRNFYPSNLAVVQVNAVEATLGFLFGVPRSYKIVSYLDGGGRDCCAVLLVPRDLTGFTLEVGHVTMTFDPSQPGHLGKTSSIISDGTVDVWLPKYDPAESSAAANGATTVGNVPPVAPPHGAGDVQVNRAYPVPLRIQLP